MNHRLSFSATTLLSALLSLACASNSDYIREARTSEYQSDFPKVWNAVKDAIHSEYSGIARENPDQGIITTQWLRVTPEEEQDALRRSQKEGTQPLFRLGAYVHRGKDGWTVSVNGSAAVYDKQSGKLLQFRRGDPTEPKWVQERIDRVYMRVYRTLYNDVIPGSAQQATPEEEAAERQQVFGAP